jgi:hypothetical protein
VTLRARWVHAASRLSLSLTLPPPASLSLSLSPSARSRDDLFCDQHPRAGYARVAFRITGGTLSGVGVDTSQVVVYLAGRGAVRTQVRWGGLGLGGLLSARTGKGGDQCLDELRLHARCMRFPPRRDDGDAPQRLRMGSFAPGSCSRLTWSIRAHYLGRVGSRIGGVPKSARVFAVHYAVRFTKQDARLARVGAGIVRLLSTGS